MDSALSIANPHAKVSANCPKSASKMLMFE
jgi:hypothetical protein